MEKKGERRKERGGAVNDPLVFYSLSLFFVWGQPLMNVHV